MRAEIVSVGTELLLGQIVNTNAQYLSRKLGELGIDVFFISCVGDNESRLKDALSTAARRADIIIITGGLGPTMDDITKETVGELLKLPFTLHQKSLERIESYFHRMGRKMQISNRKQAEFPEGAIILQNDNGTAPGCIIENEGKVYILLPGPPRELGPMFEVKVIPYLQKNNKEILVSRVIRLIGIGESTAEELVKDILIQQSNPTVAPLAGYGEVSFRITAKAENRDRCMDMIVEVEERLRGRLGEFIYGTDEDNIEIVVSRKLLEKGIKIVTAESCTGGMVANMLTNIPGISNSFNGGYIAYSNVAKNKMLSVNEQGLDRHGAVSDWTAREMALGALKASGAGVAVSTTGYAGPEGEDVGLVYIGVTDGVTTKVKELRLVGERKRIKNLAAKYALNEVRLFLMGDIKKEEGMHKL